MQDPTDPETIAAALPLRPVAFAVLTALADVSRPGFAILETVNETVPGRPILGPGTLYRLLRELRRTGWIARTSAPDSPASEDERRRYHTLTKAGRAVMHAEAARLTRTLEGAGLLPHVPRGG